MLFAGHVKTMTLASLYLGAMPMHLDEAGRGRVGEMTLVGGIFGYSRLIHHESLYSSICLGYSYDFHRLSPFCVYVQKY
jgi:hypothetical protein